MSNKFTTNSRFDVLVEDTKNIDVFNKKEKNNRDKKNDNENKKNDNENKKEENQFRTKNSNLFKSNYMNSSSGNFDSNKNKEKKEKEKERYKKEKDKEKQIIKQKEEKKLLLSIDNFPVLLENSNNNSVKQPVFQEGFIDKVKYVKPIVETNKIDNYIKPGWVEIKFDKKTRKIITTNRNPSCLIEEDANNVLKNLVNLHEKRTKDYIDLWGYDMWEKVFQFSNYDYDYFNKLDTQYDEESEDYESDSDNEYDFDYDVYS